MPRFQFIEVSPEEVLFDPVVAQSDDDGFVYDHLKRYCSKFEILPAITVVAEGEALRVTRGHKYLAIARDLRRKKVRAVLLETTYDELRARGVKGLLSEVPISALEEEEETTVLNAWHVFFFEGCPSKEIAELVRERFREFLQKSLPAFLPAEMAAPIESDFDVSAACLELRFPTPIANTEWASAFLAFCLSIHVDLLPIVTYQGRRFQVSCPKSE